MDNSNLAFGRTNFILLAIGLAVVVVGFILMSGGSTTEEMFNPAIFDARRIKVAPVVTFIGFVSIIVAIVYKDKSNNKEENRKEDETNE